jgi:perosamine synthetase
MKRINLLQPTFDEQTKKELMEVLDSGWVMFGGKTLEFEEKFAKYVGAKYAIATNSATSALDLCLKAHDITGGELITPSFTFISDALIGQWNNMEVTLCDINPRTLTIDPESIVLHNNTKAIVAVDCHGRLADIDMIKAKIAAWNASPWNQKINPLIIEDAAHAMFTPGVGKGDIVVYSFQAVKSMPIFDGGMITTNDEEIYKKLRPLTWLGIEKLTYERVSGGKYSWDYDIKMDNGIKAYMTDVQAVLGIGQMRRLEQTNARRREIQTKYNDAFIDKVWCKIPEYSHTVQYYTPEWEDRDGLSQFLSENGIHTSVHFKPIHEFTIGKKWLKQPLPGTEVWKKLLSLPVHNALTDEDQDFVIAKVKEYYAKTS